MAQGKRTIPLSKATGWVKDPTSGSVTEMPDGTVARQLTVDEARAQMLEAAEVAKTTRLGERVPSFIEQERKRAGRGTGGNTPVIQTQDFVEEALVAAAPVTAAAQRAPAVGSVEVAQPARVAAAPVAPVVAALPAVVEEEVRDRIETKDFVGEIYRDGAEWVAEITYKNGAGDERFSASSIRELNKKLLEGKGHATLKVRAEVRRRKLGNQLDTFESALIPVINSVHNLSTEQFFALPSSVQDSIVASIQVPEIQAFMQEYPEFYNVDSNWVEINQWLVKTNSPATRRNVALAFQDLTEDSILTVRPTVKVVPQATAPVVTAPVAVVPAATVDSVVESSAPAAAPVAAPRKRGSSGLVPGQSSAAPATVAAAASEEGAESQELSREQLRNLDLKAHRRLAIPSLGRPSGVRR